MSTSTNCKYIHAKRTDTHGTISAANEKRKKPALKCVDEMTVPPTTM